MAGRWNPALHPRGPNGKFKPKLSQSVRLSTRSVSYNAGVRVPLVPGRANLYVGALARVERAGGGSGYFKKTTDRVVNAAARRFGDAEGRSNVARIFKGEALNIRGNRVKGPADYVRNPTFRVSRTESSRAENSPTLRPRRVRAQRLSRARTPNLSNAVKTSGPQSGIRSPRRKKRTRSRR